jgi:hypothetical protein
MQVSPTSQHFVIVWVLEPFLLETQADPMFLHDGKTSGLRKKVQESAEGCVTTKVW